MVKGTQAQAEDAKANEQQPQDQGRIDPAAKDKAQAEAKAKAEADALAQAQAQPEVDALTAAHAPVFQQKQELTVITDEAAHAAKYPDRVSVIFSNKLSQPLPVNVCGGKKDHFLKKDADGQDVVNPGAYEQLTTCPGLCVHLLSREKQTVSVCDRRCLETGHVAEVQAAGYLRIIDTAENKA